MAALLSPRSFAAPLLLAAALAITLPRAAAGGGGATNGTIEVLAASYGANCNAALAGAMTAQVGAFCAGAGVCNYTICICGWDAQCSAAKGDPPCVPDPASACAKDFSAVWRCSADAPGAANRSLYLPAEADKRVAALTCGPPPPRFTPRNVTVAAFVYDPWTPEPAVFGEHGANFTEWELVRRAEPRFPGHLQPKVPVWGELDTSLPATWDLLNDAALAAGIEVYLWDW